MTDSLGFGETTGVPTIDRIVADFQLALQRGERPRIEDLTIASGASLPGLLHELLRVEVGFLLAAGEPIDWSDFSTRFPGDIEFIEALRIRSLGNSVETVSAITPCLAPIESSEDTPSSETTTHLDRNTVLAPLDLGDFQIERSLGAGGQGEVHLARQLSLDRPVAIKLLRPRPREADPDVMRFVREARTLAQTRHPNIVTIHGLGRLDDGGLFLVMEYVEGPDLGRRIKDGRLEIVVAVRIAAQIADAVHYAHSRGVIHRDLKPSNVLWDAIRGPIVTDFGLAKDLRDSEELTATEQLLGTPAYMAPEQADRQFGEVSVRTDVYGLGAILFALLTGRAPYVGSVLDVLRQVAADESPPDPCVLRAEIPDDLSQICLRCLAKWSVDRFGTAAELAERLREWSNNPSTSPKAQGLGTLQTSSATGFHEPSPPRGEPTEMNVLHQIWDCLDDDLQDAFAVAYNKKRRTGSNRISTRDLFQAIARIGGDVAQVIEELPPGAMPDPVETSVSHDRIVLKERPLLSDCVDQSLREFGQIVTPQRKLSAVDVFVDVAKHGHGPSVVRLREHGVDADRMERIVRKLGLRVVRREDKLPPNYNAARPIPSGGPAVVQTVNDGDLIWDDNVQFSAYRPRTIAAEKWEQLLVFAHLSDLPADAASDALNPLEEVRRQAEQVLGSRVEQFQSLTADSGQPIPREGVLAFVPTGLGLEFNPPSRNFRWVESVHREEFRFRASAALEGRTARGRISVFLGGILIAEVTLVVQVDSRSVEKHGLPTPTSNRSAYRFRRIYACVAPGDVQIAEQFKRYAVAIRDSFLLSQIERGHRGFDDAQRATIRASDVFQLYWSHNAMADPTVEEEWQYALTLKRDFVRPLYWEEPFPKMPEKSLPPPELLALGFQKIETGACGLHEELEDAKWNMRGERSSAYLQLLSGKQYGRVLRLSKDRIIVGRHPDCDLVLDNDRISRRHAQLGRDNNGWFVEDLNTASGTFVNGMRITCVTLYDGDQLHVGDVLIGFHDFEGATRLNDGTEAVMLDSAVFSRMPAPHASAEAPRSLPTESLPSDDRGPPPPPASFEAPLTIPDVGPPAVGSTETSSGADPDSSDRKPGRTIHIQRTKRRTNRPRGQWKNALERLPADTKPLSRSRSSRPWLVMLLASFGIGLVVWWLITLSSNS